MQVEPKGPVVDILKVEADPFLEIADLIAAGKFDSAQVLAWVAQYFGPLPRPQRQLQPSYTVDPVQNGERSITLQRKGMGDSLKSCQMVFIATSAIANLPRVLDELRERAVLTVADSPGAARQGVALNMAVSQGKVTFEANLHAARSAGLNLSSKLLRLATEVRQ